jgi:hypothetical protein
MTKDQYEAERARILGKKVGDGAIAEEAAGDAAGKAAGGPSGYVPPHMRNREAPAAGGQGGCAPPPNPPPSRRARSSRFPARALPARPPAIPVWPACSPPPPPPHGAGTSRSPRAQSRRGAF